MSEKCMEFLRTPYLAILSVTRCSKVFGEVGKTRVRMIGQVIEQKFHNIRYLICYNIPPA